MAKKETAPKKKKEYKYRLEVGYNDQVQTVETNDVLASFLEMEVPLNIKTRVMFKVATKDKEVFKYFNIPQARRVFINRVNSEVLFKNLLNAVQ